MSYDEQNIFARIVRGEIPCAKVHEDDHVLAFRDIDPKAPSHVLVIPKGPYGTLHDFAEQADDAALAAWVRALATVARSEGIAESGYRIICNNGEHGNQEVPHVHMHVVGGRQLRGMLPKT